MPKRLERRAKKVVVKTKLRKQLLKVGKMTTFKIKGQETVKKEA